VARLWVLKIAVESKEKGFLDTSTIYIFCSQQNLDDTMHYILK